MYLYHLQQVEKELPLLNTSTQEDEETDEELKEIFEKNVIDETCKNDMSQEIFVQDEDNAQINSTYIL